ncbi:acyl-CoA dehydrogenase [Egicoccus sp. AB-alg6-2]|uniref:acyl-CoA dehydrogenase n=1 Tax=Egicoccus sp. AB-alg6-2 TaxID=3242692 RepID=UPI00359D8C20
MSHYKSNLRDIEFNLYEVFGAADYFGTGPFRAVDADQARMLLGELERFTRESVWADSFVPADRTPLELSPEGDITIPQELDEALRAFYEAGWHLLPLPEHLGGFGAPPSIRWAASELLSGGHATAMLWPIGALMGAIIDQVGTEGQKARFGRPMIERCWGGTMVLTEPDAGSDVGAGTTRAVRVEDSGDDDLGAVYHLEGIKRFITSADAQTHENTVHLVLARPEGAGPGTKGLSLFIVPKLHVDADLGLGARNGVRVSNIEKKMGIKGSATCELSLGQDGTPCVGYLVGDVHDGIRQMFLVIEYARMMVGTKAMATLSTGYLNALEYAKVRQQGADMTQMADKTAPKVEIIKHPDVRRMLMEQKAHAEGMRALVMFAGYVQDQAALCAPGTREEATGEVDHEEHARWIAREDLLLPLVKGYCSEKAYELLALSLQTFGGSGFTQDYPIEQYIRDAKIDTLYEGTTAIQALDLLFRKIVRDQGATLTWLADQVRELVKAGRDDDPFAAEREGLGQALDDVQQHLGVLIQHAMASMDASTRSEIYKAGLNSTEFLYSLAEVVIGWLLLRQAEVAQDRLDAGAVNGDADFYTGKLASARWFLRTVPAKVALRRQKAQAEDGWLMDVPESAF